MIINKKDRQQNEIKAKDMKRRGGNGKEREEKGRDMLSG